MHLYFEKYFEVKKVRIVEWIRLSEDKSEGRVLILEKKNKNFSWSGAEHWQGIEDLNQRLNKELPTVLVIHGKGVMYRTLHHQITSVDEAIHEIVGSGEESDFFIDGYVFKDSSLVSVIRFEQLDAIVKQLNLNLLMDIMIGPISLSVLPGNIVNQNNIDSLDYNIIKNHEGFSIEKKEISHKSEIKINGHDLSTEFLLCLSAGLQYLFYINDDIKSSISEKDTATKEWMFKTLFLNISKTAAIALLLILTANFLYLNKLNNRYLSLDTQYQLNKSQITLVKNLKKEFSIREELVQKSGWDQNYSIALMVDKLARIVPKNISLESADIHPFDSKLKKNKPINFNMNLVVLSGFTPDSDVLNNWINKIEAFENVQKVVLKSYEDNKLKKNKSFTIEIVIS